MLETSVVSVLLDEDVPIRPRGDGIALYPFFRFEGGAVVFGPASTPLSPDQVQALYEVVALRAREAHEARARDPMGRHLAMQDLHALAHAWDLSARWHAERGRP